MRSLVTNFIRRISRPATARVCPICRWQGRHFAPGGSAGKIRFDCRCPRCGSLERHRLAYFVATTVANLDFASVLHVAPERQLSEWLRTVSHEYLSIDLKSSAMARMDITCLPLPDKSRTLVWVSHVLEHVVDDKKAISEIYRVLAAGGMALVQVPIWRTRTYEDLTINTPSARLEAFFQEDHVRLYGVDIVERFSEAGFLPTVFRAQDFGPELVTRHGLSFASTNEVFLFRK